MQRPQRMQLVTVRSGAFVIASVVRMDTWPDRAAMVGIFLFVLAGFRLVERINRWREERRVRKADLYGENGDA